MTDNATDAQPTGPLAGVTVLELGGIGPGPFAAMMLADMGATVVRVVRGDGWTRHPILNRGRISIEVNLKSAAGIDAIRDIAAHCDVLIEGFRPGVAERLGLGPKDFEEINPRLVYGRMTGWGQDGPWAQAPGHDINYVSLTGGLHAIGTRDGGPVPPLNLVSDFGGGGMLLAFGVACALAQVNLTGTGQVVDAAMVDGTSLLLAMTHGFLADGTWRDERQSNMLDGAAPFYRTYTCSDGQHMAVGCVEPQFYREFLQVLGLDGDEFFTPQHDQERWAEQGDRIAGVFATRSRDEWAEIFTDTQACTTPVLSLTEAAHHPHMAARATMAQHNGVMQPMPAPRFNRTPTATPQPQRGDLADIVGVLRGAGVPSTTVDAMVASGAVRPPGADSSR